jgi:hypothetical protein
MESCITNAGLYHGSAIYQSHQGEFGGHSGQGRTTEATAETQEEGSAGRTAAAILGRV